jgi:predicted P-loop ATPase
MSINIVAHFNPNGIPDYLKQRPQWIVWGKRSKKSQNALLQNGKLNRIPCEPRTGKVANYNDPSTWGTFNDAFLACQSGWYNGIGFMFTENDGLVGITLNDCFVPGTRILIPEAQKIVTRFGATFAESFPSGDESGDGLHIYCFGSALRCGAYEQAPWIELYGKNISGHISHYFCVTGNQFSATLEITDCKIPLTWLDNTFNTPIPFVTHPPKAVAEPSETPSLETVTPPKAATEPSETPSLETVTPPKAATEPSETPSLETVTHPPKAATEPSETPSLETVTHPPKAATEPSETHSLETVTPPPKAATEPSETPSLEDSSLSEFDILKLFNKLVSDVLFATKDSQKEQLFKSALALSELCKNPRAASLLTRKEVKKALSKATRLSYKTAQPIITSAFKIADDTREAPTSFEKNTPPHDKPNLKSKHTKRQANTKRQAKPDTERQANMKRQAKPDTERQANMKRQAKPDTERQAEPDTNWQAKLRRKKIGNSIIPSLRNLKLILKHDEQWQGVLGYNEFSRKIVKLKKPPYCFSELGNWQDTDDLNTAVWLDEHYNLTASAQIVSEATKLIAQHHKFHPVRDYLTSLKWDGKSRVDHWLSVYLGVLDTKYAGMVGKTWLISAVARIMKPGCKADNVLILEGEQGAYKSTALRLLCQDNAWFNDTSFDLGSKDAFLAITGKWIIELAELDSFNKANSARAKAFFSSAVDTYREPYARHTVSVPRQCVFAGSVNKKTYLKDETGNRRYLPVKCTSIDIAGIKADRDQLWAEAYQMYMNGEQWWTDANDPIIKEQQEARVKVDSWEITIAKYLDSIQEPNEAMGTTNQKPPVYKPKNEVTLTQLLTEALQIPINKQNRSVQTQVGNIMKELGWERERRQNGTVRRYFYTKEK